MSQPEISPEAARSLLRTQSASVLLVGALVMGLLLVAGYFFFVGTPTGQAWDNQGYAGRQAMGGDLRSYDVDLLQEVSKRSLFFALCMVLVLSFFLRCPFVGVVAVLAAGGAVFGAEYLKHALPRTDLAAALCPAPAYFSGDTYPSGHTTIGTSLALAIVLICGPLLRPWMSVAAGILSTSYATAVLFMGWHRPSDALGGIAWSGFCFAAATIFLVLVSGHHARTDSSSKSHWVSALLAVILIGCLWAFSLPRPEYSGSRWPFLIMTSFIIAGGFALPAWLAFSLNNISWRSLHRH